MVAVAGVMAMHDSFDHVDLGLEDGGFKGIELWEAVLGWHEAGYWFPLIAAYQKRRGMLSNFPIAVFDRTDTKKPRWPPGG
ncbi:hypothetical protein P3102_29880 [Amycolatopsis sp. QT-25]|uniref:hypothetical protein n=1 Tax=Amycolatopsis sp. QT-25 TaxID=3034022 RepID=UPI0023EBA58F|nr:hypothetical protein [Amycolatopsis sp. QT-25]WET78239.1 hypothetical protein P3102_29880 [Amycolatopsis sp. QT-25]